MRLQWGLKRHDTCWGLHARGQGAQGPCWWGRAAGALRRGGSARRAARQGGAARAGEGPTSGHTRGGRERGGRREETHHGLDGRQQPLTGIHPRTGREVEEREREVTLCGKERMGDRGTHGGGLGVPGPRPRPSWAAPRARLGREPGRLPSTHLTCF
jgi:hypothetical protein